ncbi:PDZ domain-containing protein [Edaphobacillus lindanitolerans]|uniref:PDZ domain-containing protein n=1 Tax=Edaphobacillus lindanitolerans TaxID=550447 RepID=A0A1U7PM44_9BACI|nr:PDZ domain-containing protein [Edaphobacillus lindanitolerans]SIT69051.1 PDZ domain-containing protein [Edaphobacillus lindanitolerans]
MIQEILLELLKGAGRFFLNPLFYIVLLFSVLLGYIRVKRERRDFRVRIDDGLTELRNVLSESWIHAVVLSVAIGTAGLAVPKGWLVLFCAAMLLVVLSVQYALGSPVYAAGAAALAYWLLGHYGADTDLPLIGWTYSGQPEGMAFTVPLIAGLLLLAEGMLIRRRAADDASPLLLNTARGLKGAAYRTRRLWLLPLLFVVPGKAIAELLPYWPQFTLGEETFSFIFIPVVIGFRQTAKHTMPENLFPGLGKAVIWTGAGASAASFLYFWLPDSGWYVLGASVLVRAFISFWYAARERKGNFAVSPRSEGVTVAAVLPGSPADKMGILPGETIRKVNGVSVADERELYDAIQVNAAHCRVEVLNRDGELRLCQHVIFRHDHHRIGLLVIR